MTDPNELAGYLEQAVNDLHRSFGAAPNVVKQKRNVVKIMLWDHRREIIEALKIAAAKRKAKPPA